MPDLLTELTAMQPAPTPMRTALVPVQDMQGGTRYYYPSEVEIAERRKQRFAEAMAALPPEQRAQVEAAQSGMSGGYQGITVPGALEPVSGGMYERYVTGPGAALHNAAASSIGMGVQGAARAGQWLNNAIGLSDTPFAETPDATLAERISSPFQMDPENPHASGTAGSVARTVGGLAPIVGAAMVPGAGPLLAGGMAGTQAFEGTTQEAMSHGYTEQEARGPASANALLQGGLMSLPLGHAVGNVGGKLLGKVGLSAPASAIGKLGASAVEGAGIMGTARMGENLIAGQTFDPMRAPGEHVLEAAGEGALVVGGMRGAGMGVQRLLSGKPRTRSGDSTDAKLTEQLDADAADAQRTSKPTPGDPLPVESMKQVLDARSAFKQAVEGLEGGSKGDLGFDSPGSANRAVDDVKVASKAARGMRDMVKNVLDKQDRLQQAAQAEVQRLTEQRDRARAWLADPSLSPTDYTGRIELGDYIRKLDAQIERLQPKPPAAPQVAEQMSPEARANVGLGSPTQGMPSRFQPKPPEPPVSLDTRSSSRGLGSRGSEGIDRRDLSPDPPEISEPASGLSLSKPDAKVESPAVTSETTMLTPDAALAELTDLTRKLPILRGEQRLAAEQRVALLKQIISDPTIPETTSSSDSYAPTSTRDKLLAERQELLRLMPESEGIQLDAIQSRLYDIDAELKKPDILEASTPEIQRQDLISEIERIDDDIFHKGMAGDNVASLRQLRDQKIQQLRGGGVAAAKAETPNVETPYGEVQGREGRQQAPETPQALQDLRVLDADVAAREATAKPPVQPSGQPKFYDAPADAQRGSTVAAAPPLPTATTYAELEAIPRGEVYSRGDGRFYVRSGLKSGTGDEIYDTHADAIKGAEEMRQADARKAMWEEKTKAAEENAAKEKLNAGSSLASEYAAGLPALQRGNAIKTLKSNINSKTDGVVPLATWIENRLKEGHKVKGIERSDPAARKRVEDEYARLRRSAPTGNEKHPETIRLIELRKNLENPSWPYKVEQVLESPDGSFFPQKTVTAIGMKYAKYLEDRNASTATPHKPNSSKFYDAPTDAQRGANGAQRGIPGLEAESAQAEQLDLLADKLNYATHPTNMLLRNQLKDGYREGMREALPLARTKPRELNDEAAFEQNAREVQEALLRYVDPDGKRAEADPAIDEYAYEAATKLIREYGRDMNEAERSVQTAEQRLAESTAAAAGKMGEAAQALFSEGSYAVSPEVRVVDRRLLPKGNETQEWVAKFPYRVERLLNGKWQEVTKDVTVDDALSSAKNWAEQLQSPAEPPPKAAVSPRGESAALSETPATALSEKSGPTPADRVIKLDELPKYVYEGKAMDKPPSMRERKAIARNAFGRNVDPANPSTHAPSTWINKFVRDVPGFKHNPTFIVGTTPDGVRLLYKDTKNGSYAIKPEWFGLKADDLATGQRITIDLTKPDGGPGGGAGKSVLPPSEQAYSAGNTIFTAERRRAAWDDFVKGMSGKLYSNPLDVLLDPKLYNLAKTLAGEFVEYAIRSAAGTGKRGYNEFKRWMKEQVQDIHLPMGLGRKVSVADVFSGQGGDEYLSKIWNDLRKFVPQDEALKGRLKGEKLGSLAGRKLAEQSQRAAKAMNSLSTRGFGKTILNMTGMTDEQGWNPARELASGSRNFGGKVALANEIYGRITGNKLSPALIERIKGDDAKSALGKLSHEEAELVANTLRAVDYLSRRFDEREANSKISQINNNAKQMASELTAQWTKTLSKSKSGFIDQAGDRSAGKWLIDKAMDRAGTLQQLTGKSDGTAWHKVFDEPVLRADDAAQRHVMRWTEGQAELDKQHGLNEVAMQQLVKREAAVDVGLPFKPSEAQLFDLYLMDRTLGEDGGLAGKSVVPEAFKHDAKRNVELTAEQMERVREYVEQKSPYKDYFKQSTKLFDEVMQELQPHLSAAQLELTGREVGKVDAYYHLKRAVEQGDAGLSELVKKGDTSARHAGSWGNIENLSALKQREGGPLPLVLHENPLAAMSAIVRQEADFAYKAVPARDMLMVLESEPLRTELRNRLGDKFYTALKDDAKYASGSPTPRSISSVEQTSDYLKGYFSPLAKSAISFNPKVPLRNWTGYVQLLHELPAHLIPAWTKGWADKAKFYANYNKHVAELKKASGILWQRISTAGRGQISERTNPYQSESKTALGAGIDMLSNYGLVPTKVEDTWVAWQTLQLAKQEVARTKPSLSGDAALREAGHLAAKWITRTQNPTGDSHMTKFTQMVKKIPGGDLWFMLTAGNAQARGRFLAAMYGGPKAAAKATAVQLAAHLMNLAITGGVGYGIKQLLGTQRTRRGETEQETVKNELVEAAASEFAQDILPGDAGDAAAKVILSLMRGKSSRTFGLAQGPIDVAADVGRWVADPTEVNAKRLGASLSSLAPQVVGAGLGVPQTPIRYLTGPLSAKWRGDIADSRAGSGGFGSGLRLKRLGGL